MTSKNTHDVCPTMAQCMTIYNLNGPYSPQEIKRIGRQHLRAYNAAMYFYAKFVAKNSTLLTQDFS